MAPRTGKGKINKLKGDKKKAEKVVVPVELEIGVILPDRRQVALKGISTDRILDVRRLLAVHVETCHITNYCLHHEMKGSRLRDSQEVSYLKPPVLTLIEEDYTEDQSIAHVRRLLDLFSCTTHFGAFSKHNDVQLDQGPIQALSVDEKVSPDTDNGNTNSPQITHDYEGREGQPVIGYTKRAPQGGNPDGLLQVSAGANQDEGTTPATSQEFSATAVAAAREASERGDMCSLCPPSELGQFYEFFSLSHVTPPIQSLCRSTKQERQGQEYFIVEVRLCNGKYLTVAASPNGFRSYCKQPLQDHALVSLLKRSSQAFSKAYEVLLKGFLERNKFGNIPYGLRSNTWVVPPAAAGAPHSFPLTAAEDETWGGNGGGQGRPGAVEDRPWAQQFAILAKMACGSVEQRQIRDRKAFLLHNLFVDVAVTASAEVIKQWHVERVAEGCLKDEEVYQIETRNLTITVSRDANDASKKSDRKIDGSHLRGKSPTELAERNCLKGITADQNTTIHDLDSLGVVVVRYRGYTAVAEASGLDTLKIEGLPADLEIEDQPDGGADALNVNSLRTLLHASSSHPWQETDDDGTDSLVCKIIETSLVGLSSEVAELCPFVRLELGACWLQYLQTEGGGQEAKEKSLGGVDQQPVKELERTSKESVTDNKYLTDVTITGDAKRQGEAPIPGFKQEDSDSAAQVLLITKLGEPALKRLQESGTGLHRQTVPEIMGGIRKYYEVALSKLVVDFGSLELAPVDGQTLSDFMHARGLRIRSLGRVAELSSKLPHVQSLCEHEMVARAIKHVLRAVVAATEGLASAIASVFNFAFGTVPTKGRDLLWKWVKVFVQNRFHWNLSETCRLDLRPHALLRGICHKVGIELAPRNYLFDCLKTFRKMDIISMVPVYKHVSCTSADARTLLESCKTALDKGKGEEAISYGTKALAELIAICGPNHRMTAGAYSLLAVVLYHTGDYNQAMIYQQKALDINERELGLDHPDTIKSYGDLAVFYYRLQHTELAIKYVMRALYLLHLVCGPSHPNTAATYINVAMMEEGMGNIHVSLRYLHEALKCNVNLLGPDHTQTAATYHAMAIVLSMMDAHVLSVQHEQKTLDILEHKLGKEDPRTQDSAAWLHFFTTKAVDQQEAVRNGTVRTDLSAGSKGHLSVSDLLEFINSEVGGKAGAQRKANSRRSKTKSKGLPGGVDPFVGVVGDVSGAPVETPAVNSIVEAMAVDTPTASAYEVSSEGAGKFATAAPGGEMVQLDVVIPGHRDEDDGWQSAGPRGRSAANGGRKGPRGSTGIVPVGTYGVRANAGIVGEGGTVSDWRKAAATTPVVHGDSTWNGVSGLSSRATSPGSNTVAPSSKSSSLVAVKPSISEKSDVLDGAGSDVKVGAAEFPGDGPPKLAPSTSSGPSSLDDNSPRLPRAALSYKDAALAAPVVVAGVVSKTLSDVRSDVPTDGKIPMSPAADGKDNFVVQADNSPHSANGRGATISQTHAGLSNGFSNPVAGGDADVEVESTGVGSNATASGSCLQKNNSENNGSDVPSKRWADFDLEPSDESALGSIETSNGISEVEKVHKFSGGNLRSEDVSTATDGDVQKFGRRNYWKDGYVHNFTRGGSKGRGDNHGGSDNHRTPGTPSRTGYGWSRNGRKEFDRDSRIYPSGFGNGHNASGTASSFSKKSQQPSRNGVHLTSNAGADNLRNPVNYKHASRNMQVENREVNGSSKNGLKYGQYAGKPGDAEHSSRTKHGERAVWNIKFGRVVESDVGPEPDACSESKIVVPEEDVTCTTAETLDAVANSDDGSFGHSEVEHSNTTDLTDVQQLVVAEKTLDFEENVVEKEGHDEETAGKSSLAALECVSAEGELSLSQCDLEDGAPKPQGRAPDVVSQCGSGDAVLDQQDLVRKLSAAAIPFTPKFTAGPRVVAAVTPFKDGKGPSVPVSLPSVRPPVIPSIPNTVAVTPMRKAVGAPANAESSSSQVTGVSVPSNQLSSGSLVDPPLVGQTLLTSPVSGSSEDVVALMSHKSSSMNPHAKEFVPRTMNPNAAVFIPASGLQVNVLTVSAYPACERDELGKNVMYEEPSVEGYGNAACDGSGWQVATMHYGGGGTLVGSGANEGGHAPVIGDHGRNGSETSLGSVGSYEETPEQDGRPDGDGGSSHVVNYGDVVMFSNPADVMGSWQQEIPCM